MSYKLKDLKGAMDEQIPMPELKQDLLLRAQESRPKQQNTFVIRALTAAAAVVLIVLSLSSMFAPILKPHIDNIGNDPYTAQQPNNPVQDETDNTSDEMQENPEIPEGFFFNPSGIGSWGYDTLIVSAVYFAVRLFRKAKRKETAHMLLTEIGFLVYIIALIVLAYRPMVGQCDLYVGSQIWRSNGIGIDVQFYGQQLYPANLSVQGAYITALGWSLASAAFTASLAAAYSWLRKKWAILLAFLVVLLAPWAWKVFCIDMTAAQWLSLKLLVCGIIPLASALTLLAAPVKRQIDRYAQWCSRFEDANAYGRLAQGFWWVLAAAAVFNLFIASWWGGQQIMKFSVDTDVQYGITEDCDEAWFEEVNEIYALYKESKENSSMGALADMMQVQTNNTVNVFQESSWMVQSAIRLMYEHGIDCLTPEMVMTMKIDATLETACPYENAWMKAQLEHQPLDVIWNGYGGGEYGEVIDAYYVYLIDENYPRTNSVNLNVGIEQYQSYALDFRGELDHFAVPQVYTAQFRIGLEDEIIVPEDTNANNIADILFLLPFVIGFVLLCILSDWLSRMWHRRRKVDGYIEDDEDDFDASDDLLQKRMRILRRCLAAVLILLLILSWVMMIAALRGDELFGLPSSQYPALVSFRSSLSVGISSSPEFSAIVAVFKCIVLTYGLGYSVWRLLSPRGEVSRHLLLQIFLSVELFFQSIMVLWLLDGKWSGIQEVTQVSWILLPPFILTSTAWLMTFLQNIYYTKEQKSIFPKINFRRKDESPEKAVNKISHLGTDVQNIIRKALRINRYALAAVLSLLLLASWSTAVGLLTEVGIPMRAGLFSFVFSSSAWGETSAVRVIVECLLFSTGLIWSIVMLILPRGEKKRHWMLIIYLVIELLIYLKLMNIEESIEVQQMFIIPSMILIGVSLLMALIQNLYYKFRD